MSERNQQAEALFESARRLTDPAHRAAFLDATCAGDAGLRKRLDELLAAQAEADDLFRPLPGPPAASVLVPPESLPDEQIGTKIGRYKLLQKIGEGGFGVVYLAEQKEPVKRRVALKIIKLGMDTKQVVARFEAERQALALMDHPNIARIYDGGMTGNDESQFSDLRPSAPRGPQPEIPQGRPYFVMELVRGVPITQYCDDNQLSTIERLRLFLQVCHAVQHAHQKGVIHRDLKPSNILVTLNDGQAVPKVIDFGVAKATQQELTDKTIVTQFHHFIGTPAYMSPEQATMTSLDIDTRSDIYALGVLLYELLTGKTPFDGKELLASGLDEMRRTIREKDPPRPSTRLSTMTEADRTTTARQRKSEVPKLIHQLRGDLDWIAMKCLEKDRNRRYETANGLAADIQRHLNHEPVVARPPSRLYEIQKTMRRHKVGFAATAAVIVALAAGIAVSFWHGKKSAIEAAKATAIADFLKTMLQSANPEAAKGPDYTVRQLLDETSASLGNQLENQPEVEASIRETIGWSYIGLGEGDKAQAHLDRALALRRQVFGDEHALVAYTIVARGWSLFEQDQWAAAQQEARHALEIYRLQGSAADSVLNALLLLQKTHSALAQYEEVERVTDEALALAQRTPMQQSPDVASILHGAAEAKNRQAKYAEAEAFALRALEMHERVRGADHVQVAWALLSLGNPQREQKKLAEAESTLRKAVTIFGKHYSGKHRSLELTMNSLRAVLEAKGDAAGLEALRRQELAEINRRLEQNAADAEVWLQRATLRAEFKEWEGARKDLDQALELSGNQARTKLPAVALGCLRVSERALPGGNPKFAEHAALSAIERFRQLTQHEPRRAMHWEQLGHSQRQLSVVLASMGEHDRAKAAVLSALQTSEEGDRAFTNAVFRDGQGGCHGWMGDLSLELGNFEVAERHYRTAVTIYSAMVAESPDNSFYLQAESNNRMKLGQMLERSGRLNEAVVEYRMAIRAWESKKLTAAWPAAAQLRLAALLIHQRKRTEAENIVRDVATNEESSAQNEMAWYLATWADPKERDARRAIEYAEKAVAATHRQNFSYLDTLAAAYALAGQFTNAINAQQEAIALIHNEQEKKLYTYHLDLFLSTNVCVDHINLPERASGLLAAGMFVESELLARECVDVMAKLPGSWRLFDARRILGGSLLGQGKHAEAEPLLLSSYEGLNQGTNSAALAILTDATRRLVQLYEATGRRDQAAQWKQRLAELDRNGR